MIDRKNKKVIIIEEGLKKEIKYDKLIVSTGGKAISPEIKGISGKEEWIFKLSNADDAIKIKKYKCGRYSLYTRRAFNKNRGGYAVFRISSNRTFICADRIIHDSC